MSIFRKTRRTSFSLRAAAVHSLLVEAPWPLLLAISALGWVAMFHFSVNGPSGAFCLAPGGAEYERGWRAFQIALAQFSPLQVTLSWMLMLAAMMTPLLAEPLRHICKSSLTRRRGRAVAVFLLVYVLGWLLAAQVLSMLALGLYGVEIATGLPMLFSVLLMALIWQASPIKQYCLNHCHQRPRLSPFGWAADRDCIGYGMAAAGWCISSCWALMLLPMVAGNLHLQLMLLVSAIMIIERLRPARPCHWQIPRLPGLG